MHDRWALNAAYVDSLATQNLLRARHVVGELGRCQQANGGGWVGPSPSSYLARIAAGTFVCAPQYTLHKTIMGLLDQHVVAGNEQALEIVDAFSTWFLRWTDPMDRSARRSARLGDRRDARGLG